MGFRWSRVRTPLGGSPDIQIPEDHNKIRHLHWDNYYFCCCLFLSTIMSRLSLLNILWHFLVKHFRRIIKRWIDDSPTTSQAQRNPLQLDHRWLQHKTHRSMHGAAQSGYNVAEAKPISLTRLPLDQDKLWYRHIFVYKRWRQTQTYVYWCATDRWRYGGSRLEPKQRPTCHLRGEESRSLTQLTALPASTGVWQEELLRAWSKTQTFGEKKEKRQGAWILTLLFLFSSFLWAFKSFLQFEMDFF